MPVDTSSLGYSSSLTIEETIGTSTGGPRKLVLIGSALPFMGAEWAFENQVITTWYPGNPIEATQQNLGPREMPSTWQGDWRRTLLGRTPAIYTNEQGSTVKLVEPFALREALEVIGRSGLRLRVTWQVDSTIATGSVLGAGTLRDTVPKIVREGLIKSAHFPHTRHTDIQWTVEFHWASRGGVQDRVVGTRQDDDLLQASNSMQASAAATTSAVNQIKRAGKKLTLGKLEQILNAPFRLVSEYAERLEQGVSRLRELGAITSRALTLPDASAAQRAFSSAGRLLGGSRQQPQDVTRGMSTEARAMVIDAAEQQDSYGRQPAEVQTTRTTVASVLRSRVYFASVADQTIRNGRAAQALIERLRQPTFQRGNAGAISVRESQTSRAGDLIAVHIVKQGDTATRLSVIYYKSPDHAAEILRANKLPLYQATLVPGTPVIIPTLANRPRAGV